MKEETTVYGMKNQSTGSHQMRYVGPKFCLQNEKKIECKLLGEKLILLFIQVLF